MQLSEIDDSNRDDHSRLTSADECYYFLEYTSGRDYSFSKANQIIANLKKKPSRRGLPEYQYKLQVIRQASATFKGALNPTWLERATLVPVPGSKARDHPEYDDRMERVCTGIQQGLDVRNLVIQTETIIAAHEAGEGQRPSVQDLLGIYEIDEGLSDPAPTSIAIFDDVLTAGTHFRAMQMVLQQRFPDADICGMFIARRVFPPDE